MHLRIRKRSLAEYIIFLIGLLPFFLSFLPYSCRYVLDLGWCALLVLLILYRRELDFRPIRPLLYWMLAFVLTSALFYLFHYRSMINYLWGARNNFRFYPFFAAACLFQTEQDAEAVFRIFDLLFWLNLALSLYQFAVLGLGQDNLGGIFGTEVGCNAYSNLFFVVIVSRSLSRFLNGKEHLISCTMKCSSALLLSALAELKIFYIEFALITVLLLLLNRPSRRSVLLILLGSGGLIGAAILLIGLYPEFTEVLSPQGLLKAAISSRGYTSSGDFNRLTVIPLANEWFLQDPLSQLFGLGLGNCETSHFELLNTSFYQRYGDSHYTWLSTAFLYLEMGWVGLLFLFGFFVLNERLCARNQRRGGNVIHCQTGRVLSVCALLILIYNSSLRTEAAYLFYWALALSHGKKSCKIEENRTRHI